jgi:hypothetical protein
MFILWLICSIYIAVKIVGEEHGNGDHYRDMARMQKTPEMKKAYYQKANDSDSAVGCCVIFLIFIGILLLIALF